MKKQLSILLLSSLVVLAGCTNESVVSTSAPQVSNQTETQDVSLIISPYVVNTEAIASAKMSRAGSEAAKKTGLNVYSRLDVALIPVQRLTGDKVYSVHQEQAQESFGKMNFKVPVGKYHLVALANKAKTALDIVSTENVPFPDKRATDIAYNFQEVNIEQGGTVINAELERSVAKFTLKSNDVRSSDVATVKIRVEGNCSYVFNPTTGYAADKQGNETTYDVAGNPNFAVVGSSYSFYTFLGSDDETVSISVELLDKDGQRLKKLEFSNVRLLRNKVTTYTGPLYSQSTEASFTFSGTDEFETSGQDRTFD